MAENSGIEWTNHTFNPWIGCTKVSPACDHCYAEEWDKRYEGGQHWGAKAPRRRTSEANWKKPLMWNKKAAAAGVRERVFCASLADVFDNKVPPEWRDDLFELIKATPNLDWLLLTKRPQNIYRMLPNDWGCNGYHNVWLGMTAENQEEHDKRADAFYSIPAVVHFLSCEPLLGPIELSDISNWKNTIPWLGKPLADRLDWVIIGGESGSMYRPANPDWFRMIRDQCLAAGVPLLFKQWDGATQKEIKGKGRELDGIVHDDYPLITKENTHER